MRQSTRLIVNTIVTVGRLVFTLVLGLFTTRFLMQSLGEVDWGVLTALGASGLLISMVSMSLTLSAQRHMAFELGRGDQHKLRVVFNTSLLFFLVGGMLIWLVAILVANPLLDVMDIPADRRDAAFWVLHLTLFEVVKNIITTPFQAAANARQALTFLAIFDAFGTLIRLLAAAALAWLSGDLLIKFAVILAVGQLVVTIALVTSCLMRFQETRPRLGLASVWMLREIASFASWTLVLRLGWLARLQGGTFLLNLYFGPIVNGAYALAVVIASSILRLATTMMQVVQPASTVAVARGNHQQVRMLCYFVSKYSVLLVMCISVPMILETETLLRIWLGEYPDYTASFVQLMLVWTTIVLSVRGHDVTVLAIGDISKFAIVNSSLNISALVLSAVWFTVTGSGPLALPVISVVTTLLVVIYCVMFVGSVISAPAQEWLRRTFAPIAIASSPPITAAWTVHHFMPEGTARTLLVFVVYGLLSLPMSWFVLEPIEKELFQRLRANLFLRLGKRLAGERAEDTRLNAASNLSAVEAADQIHRG